MMQMVAIVDVVECYGRCGERIKRYWIFGPQLGCHVSSIDEVGCTSLDAIAEAVQDLVAWWVLKVPNNPFSMIPSYEGIYLTYNKSM